MAFDDLDLDIPAIFCYFNIHEQIKFHALFS